MPPTLALKSQVLKTSDVNAYVPMLHQMEPSWAKVKLGSRMILTPQAGTCMSCTEPMVTKVIASSLVMDNGQSSKES